MPPRPARSPTAGAGDASTLTEPEHPRGPPPAATLITADMDTTPQETFLRLLESAQARDSDANMDHDDAAPGDDDGGGGGGETLAALMLAERHAARQRQQARADAVRRELEWDAADTHQRRHSLLSAVIGAGRPWTGAANGDGWLGADMNSSDIDDDLAAMLEEEDSEDDDDDDEDDDEDQDDRDFDGLMHGSGPFDTGAFPRSNAEQHNALAALLEIGGFAAAAAGARHQEDDDIDFDFGTAEGDNDDEDLPMRHLEEAGETEEERLYGFRLPVGAGAIAAQSRRVRANRLPSPRNETDIQRDLDALLQGRLLGTEPLNFSPCAGRSSYAPAATASTNDPSSALSYTSFFRPGASFVGEQRFPSAHECSSHDILAAALSSDGFTAADDPLQVDLRRWREAHGMLSLSSATASGSAGPSAARVPPWHSFDDRGRLLRSSGPSHDVGGQQHRTDGHGGRSETSPLLGSARNRASSHNRYAPYSAATPSGLSSSSAAQPQPQPQPGAPPALGAPIGTGTLESLSERAGVPGVFSIPVSNDVQRTDVQRTARSDRQRRVEATARRASSATDPRGTELVEDQRERWGVKVSVNASVPANRRDSVAEATCPGPQVSIDTYDPVQRQLSGFMAAHGITVASRTDVPISAHAPTTKSDITTFFTGQILHPILDGIFTIPAPSRINLAAGGWPCKSRLTRSHEADGWVQVGPFKGMKSAELLEKGKDRQWIQEVSKGWILCRWKEKEFINVAGTPDPALRFPCARKAFLVAFR